MTARGGSGAGWSFPGAWFIALVLAALGAFTRGADRREPPRSAKDVLAERFAEGGIDADEYGERLRVLEGHDTAEPTR